MYRKHLLMMAIIIVSLIVLPVQSNVTIAQTSDVLLDPISIKAVMENNGLTTVTVNARMTNLGVSSVDTLSFRIDSLEVLVTLVTVDGISASTTVIDYDRYTEIIVDLGQTLESNESVWIELGMLASDFQSDYVLGSDPTKLIGDFIFYIRPATSLANFTFTAVLPAEAILSQESVAPIFPDTDGNYTDGSSLAFIWFTQSLHPGQERAFIIRYQTPNYAAAPVQSFFVQSIVIALLGVLLGIILAVFGPRILYRLRRIGKVRFIGVTSEEEEVLEVIRQKGGSCPQKDLYTEFDMSQAKVSLILNNLEERGLVRRLREGRENVVHIMEN
ncbi:MarR family transcriptional regulator [Candidatus Thorarchaeota archaeon]|nr:MAG: MarR family transcriptional regulator [Candidatus Thorarchaeota archaeon]